MKFLKAIYDIGLINEQDEAPPPPGAEAPVEEPAAAEPAQEVVPLSPESEVMLVRLLKKALVMKIDPNDIGQINDLGDVNEKNAKDTLQKIITLMNSYTSDIDIDV